MWNLIQTAKWGGVAAWDLAKQSNFWYWWYSVIMGVDQDLQTPPTRLDAQQLAAANAAHDAGVAWIPPPSPSPDRGDTRPMTSTPTTPLTLEREAPAPPDRIFRPTLPVR